MQGVNRGWLEGISDLLSIFALLVVLVIILCFCAGALVAKWILAILGRNG